MRAAGSVAVDLAAAGAAAAGLAWEGMAALVSPAVEAEWASPDAAGGSDLPAVEAR
jgi:hypothetical protein